MNPDRATAKQMCERFWTLPRPLQVRDRISPGNQAGTRKARQAEESRGLSNVSGLNQSSASLEIVSGQNQSRINPVHLWKLYPAPLYFINQGI